MCSLSTIRFKQTFITNVYVDFYNKKFKKLFLFQKNISNDDRSSNGNNNNNKYTRTRAITLSTSRIRAIATSELSAITPGTETTKITTTTIVKTMITVTVIIIKTITKNNSTSGRNVEYLDHDSNDRSYEGLDSDSSGSGNTLRPKQLKYT